MNRTQSKASNLTFKIFFLLSLLGSISTFTIGQTRPDRFDPSGSFWILGEPPTEFSDLSAINLNVKRIRRLPPTGVQMSFGKNLPFRQLILRRENFRFTTVTVDGVAYAFVGRFLKGGVYQATNLDDDKPVLEGVLTKYKSGKKVAEAKLKFTYFGGT